MFFGILFAYRLSNSITLQLGKTENTERMRRISFIIALLLLPSLLLAQTEMSVEECIRLAWKQNLFLRNRTIDLKEAKADYTASIGSFLPRVVTNVQAGKNVGRSVDPNTNAYTTETFEQGSIGLEMTLSLFEGFSRINKVRFTKMNREKTEWELKDKQNELAYQVTDAFFKLLLEKKLLVLAEEQSKLSERYLKQTEAFVELGLKSVSDFQEVKARREGDIYRYKSRENSCRLAALYLKQLMNCQPGEEIQIQDTIRDMEVPLIPISRTDSLYALSLNILPSMQALEWRQRVVQKEYAIAAGAFSPSIYARFSIGSNCNGTFFSANQFRDNFGKYIGVGISFPLLDGLERLTNQRKHKLNIYRVKNEVELEKRQLYTDVEQTVLSLHSGYDEHRQVLSQMEAERLVLKESERKWEEGLISVFQLMEARNRFISVKAEVTRVRLQLEILLKMEKYYREGKFL